MSSPLLLRAFVNERLTAAADEIFHCFERTILKYEDEASSSKQEIERLRGVLLELASNTNHNTGLLTIYTCVSGRLHYNVCQGIIPLICNCLTPLHHVLVIFSQQGCELSLSES